MFTQLIQSWLNDKQVFFDLWCLPTGGAKLLLYLDPTNELLWCCDRDNGLGGGWEGGMGDEIELSSKRPRNFLYLVIDLLTLGYVDSVGAASHEPWVSERYPEYKLKLNSSNLNYEFTSINACLAEIKNYYEDEFDIETPPVIRSAEGLYEESENLMTMLDEQKLIVVKEILSGEYMKLAFQKTFEEGIIYKVFIAGQYQYFWIQDGHPNVVTLNNYDGGYYVRQDQINYNDQSFSEKEWPSGFFDSQYMFNVGHFVPTFLMIDRNLTMYVAKKYGMGLLVCRLSDEGIDTRNLYGVFQRNVTVKHNVVIIPDFLGFGRTDYPPVDISGNLYAINAVTKEIEKHLSQIELDQKAIWYLDIGSGVYNRVHIVDENLGKNRPSPRENKFSDLQKMANDQGNWIAKTLYYWNFDATIAAVMIVTDSFFSFYRVKKMITPSVFADW